MNKCEKCGNITKNVEVLNADMIDFLLENEEIGSKISIDIPGLNLNTGILSGQVVNARYCELCRKVYIECNCL